MAKDTVPINVSLGRSVIIKNSDNAIASLVIDRLVGMTTGMAMRVTESAH